MTIAPILATPPFPGARINAIAFAREPEGAGATAEEARACLDALAAARVGGSFWAVDLALDPARRPVAVARDVAQAAAMRAAGGPELLLVDEECDPWALIAQAESLWLDAADPTALLARAAGRSVRLWGDGPFAAIAEEGALLAFAAEHLIDRVRYVDPFSGADMSVLDAIDLLSHWRGLIDSNRDIVAAAGFARWKRDTVEPLLWGGGAVRYLPATRAAFDQTPKGPLAVWKSRVPRAFLARAEATGRALVEVEDGFIRSAGLGANCVPPLSITVDRLGAHFDPAQPSELENILQTAEIDARTLERAERLRNVIVTSGISKYAAGGSPIERAAGERCHILVTGQVEDDRSVLSGGGVIKSNLELLRRVRAREPDAYILYRPHPDVEAGHREGHVPAGEALKFADAIVADAPITALIEMVDRVHVLTSLTGFEALLRGKPVTTHGAPFYAGWGLTTDLGNIPARRTRRRSIAELVAAVLLLYPRYLDPETGLPCPPETLVERLAGGARRENPSTVAFRRAQGALRRGVSRMISA